MWETRHSIADWVCFKTHILLEILRTRNQFQVVSCVFLAVGWMCKKQTSVSHSSTESEVILLDVGLRMDGLFALDLWDIVIEVLRSTNNNVQPKHTSHQETESVLDSKSKTQHVKRKQKVAQLSEVDHVPTNTHFFSRCES